MEKRMAKYNELPDKIARVWPRARHAQCGRQEHTAPTQARASQRLKRNAPRQLTGSRRRRANHSLVRLLLPLASSTGELIWPPFSLQPHLRQSDSFLPSLSSQTKNCGAGFCFFFFIAVSRCGACLPGICSSSRVPSPPRRCGPHAQPHLAVGCAARGAAGLL